MSRWPLREIPHDVIRSRPPIRKGWRLRRHTDRMVWVLIPLWFYPVWWAWQRRWAPVRLCCDRGWLWCKDEMGWYRDARPAWYWRQKLAPVTPWFDRPYPGFNGLTPYQVIREHHPIPMRGMWRPCAPSGRMPS